MDIKIKTNSWSLSTKTRSTIYLSESVERLFKEGMNHIKIVIGIFGTRVGVAVT